MKQLCAKDVMNTTVLTVTQDMSVHELAEFLTEHQISGAPVQDAAGKLIGVVSLTDIAESDGQRLTADADRPVTSSYHRGWEDQASPEDIRQLRLRKQDLLVQDIMTPAVYSVPEDTPVAQVARTMISGRIHRLLVTRHHRVAGIVTTLDLLNLVADDTPHQDRDQPQRLLVR